MNNLLTIIVILGLCEGLTEFLPISSTGHIIIIEYLLGFEYKISKTLEIFIQLGANLAVVIFFRNRIFNIIKNSNILFKHKFDFKLNLIHIIIGIIPASILGLFFHDYIKLLFNPKNVVYSLITGSLLLILAECLKPKKILTQNINSITYAQAFLIGCFQCLALWPGFSRSGATISGGVLMGIKRKIASEFSFLLSVPITIGATLLDLYKNISYLTIEDILIFSIGFLITFIIAFLVIKLFLKIINYVSFIPFAIYRCILALVIYNTL